MGMNQGERLLWHKVATETIQRIIIWSALTGRNDKKMNKKMVKKYFLIIFLNIFLKFDFRFTRRPLVLAEGDLKR